MTVDTKETVTKVAYMIGVKKSIITEYLDSGLVKELEENRDATTIRYLCKLRTIMMQKFRKTDNEMRYNLRNIDSIEWFDHDNIKQLEKWGMQVILTNTRSDQYAAHFNTLIRDNIEKCKDIFGDWFNWEYLKGIFVVPKLGKKDTLKHEFDKYMANITFYPYQMYIYWPQPQDVGNIFVSDKKFIRFLYGLHNDYFDDSSKFRDAHEETKLSIYSFIEDAEKIAIVVDCENSDAYKLYGVLKNLNSDELEKVSKIVLYDDYHTGSGWDSFERFTDIPVEHIETERVTDHKSLVDIQMAAGVTKDFYKNDITSFILCSSDSDYWGLISQLPDAHFLVMYEYSKCGQAIKDALETRGIYYCAIDDFCTANTDEFKRDALFTVLQAKFPEIVGMDSRQLLNDIYTETRINASEKEMENFYTKYIKTLRLRIDQSGKFYIDIDR